MEGYTFKKGAPAREAQFLFNRPEHLYLQRRSGWHTYYVADKSDTVVASLNFHLDGETARSPFRAPFGSFELTALPPEVLFEFIGFAEAELAGNDIRQIVIKEPPIIFDPARSGLVQSFLINKGYHVTAADVSAVIDVDGRKPSGKLDEWSLRKFNQGVKAGLHFSIANEGEWVTIYDFIQTSRVRKGYALSMSKEELAATIKTFPRAFRFFKVEHEGELAAACVALLVRSDILYAFYFDHLASFDNLSPVVTLVVGMQEYCSEAGIKLLDLGTSSRDVGPNFGLLAFKLRLGANPSSKLTFEKRIS